jgi:PKD repeat protein
MKKAISAQNTKMFLENPNAAPIASGKVVLASMSTPCVVKFDDTSKMANGEPVYITASGWPSLDNQEWVVQNFDQQAKAASLANSDTSKETAVWSPEATWTLNAFADVCAQSYQINQNPATSIDTTTLCDTEKTSLVGFRDPGTLTFDFFIDPTDPDYLALNDAYKDGEERMFEIIYRNGAVRTLPVIVQSINETGGVDQAVHGAATLKITGEPILTQPVSQPKPVYLLTASVTPATGAAPLAATLTLTESGARATSFGVTWGDGTALETLPGGTVMKDHTYVTAGDYTGSVAPDLHGVPGSVIQIPKVTVTAGPPYGLTPALDPLAGAAPLTVALTLTEVNGVASSIDVDWGDGTPPDTITGASVGGAHDYTDAGSFDVTVTPTVSGVVLAAVPAGTVEVSALTRGTRQ